MSEFFPAEFEVIEFRGCIQKEKGDWTAQEGEAFMDEFFAFLEERHLGYGGSFQGLEKPKAKEGTAMTQGSEERPT